MKTIEELITIMATEATRAYEADPTTVKGTIIVSPLSPYYRAGMRAVVSAILDEIANQSAADPEAVARLIFEARGPDRGTTNGEPMSWEDAAAWFHPPMPDNHPVSASRRAAEAVLAYLSPWMLPDIETSGISSMTVAGIGTRMVTVVVMDDVPETVEASMVRYTGVGVDETVAMAIAGAMLARAENLKPRDESPEVTTPDA